MNKMYTWKQSVYIQPQPNTNINVAAANWLMLNHVNIPTRTSPQSGGDDDQDEQELAWLANKDKKGTHPLVFVFVGKCTPVCGKSRCL